ncbi:MAG TPA: SUMF1/EgtB/PvdO family nonheme iron enzyme [Prolixibacteraceae bacterium]|nr:SUMF1/EgtB/PvdO family nonheme iron enzyme [Prolixibacteraceae bacterium]
MKRRAFILKATQQSIGLAFIPPLFSMGFSNDPDAGAIPEMVDEKPIQPMPDIISTPDHPEEWQAFRNLLKTWREDFKQKTGYDDSLYERADFQWVSSAFNCYFLMMYDELFYDWKEGKYTVERFVSESEKAFGRMDIVVLWHAYPRIGLDDRNQFDFYREMPGGLSELKNIAALFHQRGIKVYINYNPWDTGTRREINSDVESLTCMIKEMDADGIFLDTMAWGAKEFREKLDKVKPGVVLESELALPAENVFDHHMSWAQWFADSKAPGILRNKWFERRHIQHGISRWQRDRTKELHTAWMNGSGIMIWENVFGQWVGWNERDKSILRIMAPIQKRYSYLFCGEGWIPMADNTPVQNVYANLWHGNGIRLWTLVNRSEKSIEGGILHLEPKAGDAYFDLIQGIEIPVPDQQQQAVLSGKLPARGIGCIIAAPTEVLGNDFKAFLSAQAELYKTLDYTTEFPAIQAKKVPVTHSKRSRNSIKGMVEIPSFSGTLEVVFRVREVGFYNSIDPSFVNIGAPALHYPRIFSLEANLPGFLLDETPVTNAQYELFLKKTGYTPKEPQNFLKHWSGGKIPAGKEDHPVVYVDLTDARAYAAWLGKRLPDEKEWQFAAQGTGNNKYPWGQKLEPGFCNAGEWGDTSTVKAYPKGISVFGCYDLCGNTWEMTESEHSDGRNRFCILKGGSWYQAKGSDWYFDGGPQPNGFAAKQLLIFPGLDRCSTVGFRCAADLK